MTRPRTLLLAIVLIGAGLALAPQRPGPQGSDPALRLIGPMADLACDIQWIRFQRARLRGDAEQAIRLAESALELDPGSTDGWILAAAHLALYRASPERESDLARRRIWFQAGMATALRGADLARDPEELHLWRGAVYLSRAEVDPEIDPGGVPALLHAAEDAFEAAHRAGSQLVLDTGD